MSGVLLFALSSEAARSAAQLFKSGGVSKKQIAVVRGHTGPSGTIDHALRPVRDSRIQRGEAEAGCAHPAVTDYRRLAAVELKFRHPVSAEAVCISAAPDASFRAVLARLGWENAW